MRDKRVTNRRWGPESLGDLSGPPPECNHLSRPLCVPVCMWIIYSQSPPLHPESPDTLPTLILLDRCILSNILSNRSTRELSTCLLAPTPLIHVPCFPGKLEHVCVCQKPTEQIFSLPVDSRGQFDTVCALTLHHKTPSNSMQAVTLSHTLWQEHATPSV